MIKTTVSSSHRNWILGPFNDMCEQLIVLGKQLTKSVSAKSSQSPCASDILLEPSLKTQTFCHHTVPDLCKPNRMRGCPMAIRVHQAGARIVQTHCQYSCPRVLHSEETFLTSCLLRSSPQPQDDPSLPPRCRPSTSLPSLVYRHKRAQQPATQRQLRSARLSTTD